MQRKKRSSRGKQINIDNFLDKYGTPFDIVMETIQQLPNSRMQDILLKRFGLSGSDFETLEAIGKEMGVTRERIRQIENEALKKLINNKNIKGIEELAKRINNLLLDYLSRIF